MKHNKGGANVLSLVFGLLLIAGGTVAYVVTHKAPAPTTQEKPGATPGSESQSEYTCNSGVCTWYKTVSCNTASTTMFSMGNPFGATSTVSVFMTGTGQATTTTFSIGTTSATKISGLALTDISPSLVNGGSVATGTQFTLLSGVTTPLGSGQISAGSGTITRVVIAPTSRVAGFATSTATGAGAANYSGSFTGCRAILKFER